MWQWLGQKFHHLIGGQFAIPVAFLFEPMKLENFSYSKLLRRNDSLAMAAKCMPLNINEVSSLNGDIAFQFLVFFNVEFPFFS